MLLGNDVVDLHEEGAAGKHLDARFLGRVFTSEEAACIRLAAQPSLALWMIWAVKESIFKVARKIDPELVFAHRDYSLGEEALSLIQDVYTKKGEFCFQLACRELHLAVLLSWTPDYVHSLTGWNRQGVLQGRQLRELTAARVELLGKSDGQLSERELESVHSEASREVRLLAKRILSEQHEIDESELVRRWARSRFLPPEFLGDGQGVDLSLSHDGRFVAAVIAAPMDAN